MKSYLNPYPASAAVATASAWVRAKRKITPGLCDHYVALLFGWGHSGAYDAQAHWDSIPADYKLKAPTTGALVFYGNRTKGHGHVALIVAGHDPKHVVIATPDIAGNPPRNTPGAWTHQLADAPVKLWGMHVLGYARPVFPHGTDPASKPKYTA